MTAPVQAIVAGQWSTVIDPIAKKFEVAAAFDQNAVFNAEGSKALGQLIREMARIIDQEIAVRSTLIAEKG